MAFLPVATGYTSTEVIQFPFFLSYILCTLNTIFRCSFIKFSIPLLLRPRSVVLRGRLASERVHDGRGPAVWRRGEVHLRAGLQTLWSGRDNVPGVGTVGQPHTVLSQ